MKYDSYIIEEMAVNMVLRDVGVRGGSWSGLAMGFVGTLIKIYIIYAYVYAL